MNHYAWKESFEALGDALERLEEVIDMPLDDRRIIADATIQRFEFTFELFWKTLKRVLLQEGIDAKTPKETLQKAFQLKWIDSEELWINMLRDRNETSHIYDEEKAKEIFEHIKVYFPSLKSAYELLSSKIKL